MTWPTLSNLRCDIKYLFIFIDQSIDRTWFNSCNKIYQGINAICFDRHTECNLCAGLISICNCNEAHIVTKARDFKILSGVPTNGSAHPMRNSSRDSCIADMSRHNFAGQMQTRLDMSMFAITMRCLVEVHEIHINGFPWQSRVRLGM